MRREFPVAVKKAAFARAAGRCEDCGQPFQPGQGPEYDHAIEDALYGEPTLENCLVLCTRCHRRKTSSRAPAVAKALRIERKRAGIVARKATIPGSRGTNLKKKISGEVVARRPD